MYDIFFPFLFFFFVFSFVIPAAGHHVVVSLGLLCDHLRDIFGMVGHVGVHDDDEITRGVLDPMNVGRSQAQLPAPRTKNNPVLPIP